MAHPSDLKTYSNMKKLIILFTVLLSAVTMVAQTSFKVIPPQGVVAGDKFYVKFRVTNGESGAPSAPNISGCKLLSPRPGRSTIQSYSNINGHSSSSTAVEYTFMYRAEKEGTFTIPAVSLNIDGKNYTTQATRFSVMAMDRNTRRQSAGSMLGWDDDPTASSDYIDHVATQSDVKPISGSDIFVRIIPNKQHVYEQEAVECTLKLYTKYQSIVSFAAVSPATFDGFLIDDLDVQGQLNTVETYNGQQYLTAVLKRCILFPQKSGKLTVSTGTYDLVVQQIEKMTNGWFYTARPVEKKVKLQAFTSTINISPLPEPRPAGFTNAVGKFQFESQLSTETFRTGEPITLSYIATGTGNIKYLDMPKPELPSEFEQYTPKPNVNTRVEGTNITGTNRIDYTFVPQSVGEFKIPGQTFVYFDPSTAKYVTITTPEYILKVEKGTGNPTGEQSDIKKKNTDILHIKLGEKELSHNHGSIVRELWYWSIYGVLIIGLLVALWLSGRHAAMMADVAGRRNARAGKVAQKRLRAARRLMDEGKSEDFYAEMLRAIWGYLSDKLSMPVSQLNRENIATTLEERGADPLVIDSVIAVLDNCEMARYTPGSGESQAISHVYEQEAKAIDTLERTKLLHKA